MPIICFDRLQQKKKFINLAFKDKKAAAQILRDKAVALENCSNPGDVLYALQDIMIMSRDGILKYYD